jgi:hypothetical protein
MARSRTVIRTRATASLIVIAAATVALIVALASGGASSPTRASGSFAWLHPAPTPAGWNVARTVGGATLAYPPGWRPIKTDPGTASAAVLGAGGRIEGYLNATPRQGAETLANWSRFRPEHVRREGARGVRLLASTSDAQFRSGRGSCVLDTYTTSKDTYREIACLVSGRGSSAVVVAAAPSVLWGRHAKSLERAVASFAA